MNRINCFSIALLVGLTACVTEEPLDDESLLEQEDTIPGPPIYVPRGGDVLVLTMTGEPDGVARSLDAPYYGRNALPGDPVNQFRRHTGDNQRWQLISAGNFTTASGATVPTFRLRNQWSGLCIDFAVQGIQQQSCNDPNRVGSTRFYFTVQGSYVYLRTAVAAGYAVDVPNGAAQDGLQVQRYGFNGAPNQRWLVEKCAADGCSVTHTQGY